MTTVVLSLAPAILFALCLFPHPPRLASLPAQIAITGYQNMKTEFQVLAVPVLRLLLRVNP